MKFFGILWYACLSLITTYQYGLTNHYQNILADQRLVQAEYIALLAPAVNYMPTLATKHFLRNLKNTFQSMIRRFNAMKQVTIQLNCC